MPWIGIGEKGLPLDAKKRPHLVEMALSYPLDLEKAFDSLEAAADFLVPIFAVNMKPPSATIVTGLKTSPFVSLS